MRRARGYDPLTWSADTQVLLDRIIHRAREMGPGHVAVFDLDGCLFDNRPRQIQILREFAAKEHLTELYRVEPHHFQDWSMRTTMRNAGIADSWIEEHYPRIRAYWESTFFTSAYCLYDHAMPGAVQLVRAIHHAGMQVVYLTGRDETMRAGTDESLRRFGFPLGVPRTQLIVKPTFEMDDTTFKEGAMEGIAALGKVAIYIDNEPANVNMFRARHPAAMVVFVETDHSHRPDLPDPEIPWLRNFLGDQLGKA